MAGALRVIIFAVVVALTERDDAIARNERACDNVNDPVASAR
ncbi:MAG TPA: hypothetical protein VM165_05330 [Planctomycetaceae bacterium]|nr:hypothetical protein [Planctomycetaceae bacterium]